MILDACHLATLLLVLRGAIFFSSSVLGGSYSASAVVSVALSASQASGRAARSILPAAFLGKDSKGMYTAGLDTFCGKNTPLKIK